MYCVGIDIGNEIHEASVTNNQGMLLGHSISVSLLEGIYPNTALGAVCRSLPNRIYSVVKEHRPHQPRGI